MLTKNDFFEQLRAKCTGPLIDRNQAYDLSGHTLSIGHQANLDSLGIGCPGRVRVGRRVAYLADNWCRWFSERVDGLV